MTGSVGSDIKDTLNVGSSERSHIFTPDTAWSGDIIQIIVDPALEEVAANNFRNLLDHIDNETIDDTKYVLTIALNAICD